MNPLKLLKEATKAVPATKWALGVTGVLAAVAIIKGLGLSPGAAALSFAVMLLLMVALVAFAKLTTVLGASVFRIPAVVLLWFAVLLTCATGTLLFTSVFFMWPQDLAGVFHPDSPNAAPAPRPDPTPEQKHLFNTRRSVLINPGNAATASSLLSEPADVLRIDGVQLELNGSIRLLGNTVIFANGASLHAREILVIAERLENARLITDGDAGSPDRPPQKGGDVIIIARATTNVSVSARGGAGARGADGEPGARGDDGADGIDGNCGPGVLGQFVMSTSGANGGRGHDANDGLPGQPGAPGGLALSVLEKGAEPPRVDASGGPGGPGGSGGAGGAGGSGGQGGDGCQGIGGSQPTRPNGRPGERGTSGRDGAPGATGSDGAPELHVVASIDRAAEAARHAADLLAVRAELARLLS